MHVIVPRRSQDHQHIAPQATTLLPSQQPPPICNDDFSIPSRPAFLNYVSIYLHPVVLDLGLSSFELAIIEQHGVDERGDGEPQVRVLFFGV